MLTVVAKEGAYLLMIALVIGSVGSVFASRVLSGLLFGVSPNDPGHPDHRHGPHG